LERHRDRARDVRLERQVAAADEDVAQRVVFLHGAGEVGGRLASVGRDGPLELAAAGRKFPFNLVAPQSPHLFWNPIDVNAFL